MNIGGLQRRIVYTVVYICSVKDWAYNMWCAGIDIYPGRNSAIATRLLFADGLPHNAWLLAPWSGRTIHLRANLQTSHRPDELQTVAMVTAAAADDVGDAIGQKTLPGTDNSVIPLQLLQSLVFPFFGSFTIIPLVQSLGTFSPFQQLFISLVKTATVSGPSCFSSSAAIPDLLFFSAPMAFSVSAFVMIRLFVQDRSTYLRKLFRNGERAEPLRHYYYQTIGYFLFTLKLLWCQEDDLHSSLFVNSTDKSQSFSIIFGTYNDGSTYELAFSIFCWWDDRFMNSVHVLFESDHFGYSQSIDQSIKNSAIMPQANWGAW